MRSGLRALVLGLVSALLLSSIPMSIALAADVATTTTLGPLPASVYRTDIVDIDVTIAPAPPVADVILEWSTDGVEWSELFRVTIDDGSGVLDTSATQFPEGTLQVRARFPGATGYAPSASSVRVISVSRMPSTVTLTATSAYAHILPATSPVTLHAQPSDTGTVEFDRKVGADWVLLGSASVIEDGKAHFDVIGGLGAGTASFRARYLGAAYSAPSEATLDVTPVIGDTEAVLDVPAAVEATVPYAASLLVTAAPNSVSPTGTVTFTDKVSGSVLGSGPINVPIALPAHSVASITIVGTYSGDANFASSTAEQAITYTANTVHASSVGLSSTSIYPYKDGYKDTVAIRGSRQEDISVSIKIYSPTNRLVVSRVVGAGSGAYSFTWNGRWSSGAALASGKYRVVQALTDAAGTTATFTNYVSLSLKKLITKSGYVTKLGTGASAIGGNENVTVGSGGVVTMKAGTTYVALGYAFSLPSATVYKGVSFEVYSKNRTTAPPNYIGMQNFTACPYSSIWDLGCFDRFKTFSTSTGALAWKATGGSVTHNRHGKIVRGVIFVDTGTVVVYKVRVKVTYAVLG